MTKRVEEAVMADAREATGKGLRLVLPGAPDTPHWLAGVPGFFWPGRVTPVGGPGEITLDDAKRYAQDPGCPLELVSVKAGELEGLRADVAGYRDAARRALKTLGGRAEGAEVDRVNDEAAAAAEVK